MSIKAIETVYNGYRFRSRLEARWAVFFDALSIKWNYEPEGYDLGALGWYLPDFWLPQVSKWAEVKATSFSKEERQKCEALAQGSGHSVLMLDGPPASRNYWACESASSYELLGDDGKAYTAQIVYMDYQLDETHRYWETESRFYAATGAADFSIEKSYDYDHPIDCVCNACDPFGAIKAARQARFEHGETPRVA